MAAKKAKALAKTEKKILITGGTGFLGTHIVRQFLGAGEKNLRVMASSVPVWMKDAGVDAVEGSVTNREDVANAVRNSTPFIISRRFSLITKGRRVIEVHEWTRILSKREGRA